MTDDQERNDERIQSALREARETRALRIASGARHTTGEFFQREFGDQPAIVVADENTFAAAGRDVVASLRSRGVECAEPFLFRDSKLYAEYSYVEELLAALQPHACAIPIAVGSGTINDLVKLVAHRLGRSYLAVATAASMDGYTAFGASITHNELKQTFDCPAPAAVLADLDVIAAAPEGLNASGYADLAAKLTAGADWIVADALGIEPIDLPAWDMVQSDLRFWLNDPVGVRSGDPACIGHLTTGLMMGGFAMQRTRTSRPASGAEHQFSHLWDMQHHTHEGRPPSHGFKVGIGSLASIALYEQLLAEPLEQLDVDAACAAWPELPELESAARTAFETAELTECAVRESTAKYIDRATLLEQLVQLREHWPSIRDRLREHLPPFAKFQQQLRLAGCPYEPGQIGISRARLIASYRQAAYIRRRFTGLDLALRAGVFNQCVARMAGPEGVWSESRSADA